MNDLHPVALFRLSVLGPLVSRDRLERGELKRLIRELASRDYDIPGSVRREIGEKTIEAWYYAWRRGALMPCRQGPVRIEVNPGCPLKFRMPSSMPSATSRAAPSTS